MKTWQSTIKSIVYGHAARRKLTPAAALVILRHMDFADFGTGKNAYPTVDRLAEECGVNEKTVRRALERAEELGIVVQVRRGGGYGATARGNTYDYVGHENTGHRSPELPTADSTSDMTLDVAPDPTPDLDGTRPTPPDASSDLQNQPSQRKKKVRPRKQVTARNGTKSSPKTMEDFQQQLQGVRERIKRHA